MILYTFYLYHLFKYTIHYESRFCVTFFPYFSYKHTNDKKKKHNKIIRNHDNWYRNSIIIDCVIMCITDNDETTNKAT